MHLVQSESDAEVVRATLTANRHAFEILVKRYTRMAYAIAHAQLGSCEDAEDAVQEAWAQAFSSLDRLRNPEQFRPWFASIVRNTSINSAKRKWRERPLEEASDLGMCETRSQIEQDDLRQALWAQLDTLSPDHREVLGLFYYAGMTADEIAQALAESRETIKKRLQRARAALDQQMLRNLYEPADRDEERLRKRVMALLLVLPVSWEHKAEHKPVAPVKRVADAGATATGTSTRLRWLVGCLFALALLAGSLFLWYAAEPGGGSSARAAQGPTPTLPTNAKPIPAKPAAPEVPVGKGGKIGK